MRRLLVLIWLQQWQQRLLQRTSATGRRCWGLGAHPCQRRVQESLAAGSSAVQQQVLLVTLLMRTQVQQRLRGCNRASKDLARLMLMPDSLSKRLTAAKQRTSIAQLQLQQLVLCSR